jgi:uncharacterized phage infection (PIP) family protein YhgE
MREQQLSLNGGSTQPLKQLAAQLIDPRHRDHYAELIAWIESVPPTDEIARIAFLLGYLTLIGRGLPEEIASERQQFRELLAKSYSALQQAVKLQAEYYDKLTHRLSKLPEEIAAGVKPAEIAKSMGESFRQQLAVTGIEETKGFLIAATADLRRVAGALDAAIKPISERYGNLIDQLATQAGKVEEQTNKLLSKANSLEEKNSKLREQIQRIEWYWFATAIVVLLLIGWFFGAQWQTRKEGELSNAITVLQQQIEGMNDTLKHPVQSDPALKKKKTAKGRETNARAADQ